MTDCLEAIPDLINRLRGIYNTHVNDGAGLLNGSQVFTKNYNTHPFQKRAALIIENLFFVHVPKTTYLEIDSIIKILYTELDWLGLGLDPYVAPINIEAIKAIKFLSGMI